VARGCPQRCFIAPVVDELIEGLNENGYYMLGYADDIAILVSGRFPHNVSKLLQEALSMV
jgi:hypothetical protein